MVKMVSCVLCIFYHNEKNVALVGDRLDYNSGMARALPRSQKVWNVGPCIGQMSSDKSSQPLEPYFLSMI